MLSQQLEQLDKKSETLARDALEALKPLLPHNSKLTAPKSSVATLELTTADPEGVVLEAVEGLNALSKKAAGWGGGESEILRVQMMAEFKGILKAQRLFRQELLRGTKEQDERLREVKQAAANAKKEAEEQREKYQKEIEQLRKDKAEADKENTALKIQLIQAKADSEKAKAVESAKDATMQSLSSQFRAQFTEMNSQLSTLQSIVETTVGTTVGSTTGSAVASARLTQKPASQPRLAQNLAEDLNRLFQYLDSSRLALLFMLSSVFYPDSDHLQATLNGIPLLKTREAGMSELSECLTTYQSKTSKCKLPSSEHQALITKLAPIFRALYTRESKMKVSDILTNLESMQKSVESQPTAHKTTNSFYTTIISALVELGTSRKLSDAPFPTKKSERAFAEKFSLLFKHRLPILPPHDLHSSVTSDYEAFTKAAEKQVPAGSSVTATSSNRQQRKAAAPHLK